MKSRFFYLSLATAFVLMGAGCVSFSGSPAAQSGPAGMFVSTDKAQNWSQISQLPTSDAIKSLAGASVYRLVGDPQDPGALYWLSRENGFFYSYDEGKTWRQPAPPLNTGFIYALAVHPANKCVLFATNGEQVYKSVDCSRSWSEVYRELRADARITGLAFDPFAPYDIFLVENNGDLFASGDAGKSWRNAKRFETPLVDIQADAADRNTLYVASRANGLYRSGNGGITWTSLSETMKDFSGALEYRRFTVHPAQAGVLYWISTYGILVSRDHGDSWKSLDLITPPGSAQIYGFAVNSRQSNELYYAATINNRSTFYKSIDGGRRWTTSKLPSGQIPTALRVHPARDNVIYLGFTILPQ